jgi:3-oxoacyl-[acyl-carrier-protein] synthase-1
MEAAFCCLALRDGFVPVSAHITELDPEFDGVNVVATAVDYAPRVALTNSSGFGGTNVSVALGKWEHSARASG